MLRWLISAVGFAMLRGGVAAVVRRAARRGMVAAIAILFWVVAVALAIAALGVWISQQLGPVAACAILAGAFAFLGIVLQVGLMLSARRSRSAIHAPIEELKSAASGFRTPDVASLAPLAVIGIAGYLLGRLIFRK